MPPLRPSLLIVAAAFCFALMAVFTRNAGAPIMAVAAWRSVVVALVFGVWALAAHGPQSLMPRDPKVLRLAALYGDDVALEVGPAPGGGNRSRIAVPWHVTFAAPDPETLR